MSHFTHIQTSFQNLFYLEKALKKLNIDYTQRIQTEVELRFVNLIISQLNGSDIKFCWNGQEYELVIDISFWEQPYTIENFIDKVAQQYASEVIIGESQKIGFQPVRYQQNLDGSNTLVLERWSTRD